MRKSIAEFLSSGNSASKLCSRSGSMASGASGISPGLAKDLFIALLLGLSATASFGLGRLSAIEESRPKVRIEQVGEDRAGNSENNINTADASSDSALPNALQAAVAAPGMGNFVASKSGVAYHYPWCSGAKRIKEENKVYFETKAEADAAGYRPAANCPGLE